MKLLSLIIFVTCFASCLKEDTEPLFKGNPMDSVGVKYSHIVIKDSIKYFTNSSTGQLFGVYYFHVNLDSIPKFVGKPIKININLRDYFRTLNNTGNKFSFYDYDARPNDGKVYLFQVEGDKKVVTKWFEAN